MVTLVVSTTFLSVVLALWLFANGHYHLAAWSSASVFGLGIIMSSLMALHSAITSGMRGPVTTPTMSIKDFITAHLSGQCELVPAASIEDVHYTHQSIIAAAYESIARSHDGGRARKVADATISTSHLLMLLTIAMRAHIAAPVVCDQGVAVLCNEVSRDPLLRDIYGMDSVDMS